MTKFYDVSVPYRGFRFLTGCTENHGDGHLGFRPLSGIPVSNSGEQNMTIINKSGFPSPIGDSGF